MPDAPMTRGQRALLASQIGDAKPAGDGLLESFAKSVADMREHDHTTQREDLYCLNLAAYMGERAAPVLRRLIDAEAEVERLRAELAAAVSTVAAQAQRECEHRADREDLEHEREKLIRWHAEDGKHLDARRAEVERLRALVADATEYHVILPEAGGMQLRVRRQGPGFGDGWAALEPRYGGGRAWTREGWQDTISALSVDRLFCWPDAPTAIREGRVALAADAERGGSDG